MTLEQFYQKYPKQTIQINGQDFAFLDDRVLLILAEDDETFAEEARQQLVDIMTNPTTIKDMGGGHLGALMDIENYVTAVADYMKERA